MAVSVRDINGRSVAEAFEGVVLEWYRDDFMVSELNDFVEDYLADFDDEAVITVYPNVWRAVMTFVTLVGRGFDAEVVSVDVNTHFMQNFIFLKTWCGKLFWDKYAHHSIDVFDEGKYSLWWVYKSGDLKKFLESMTEAMRIAENEVVELKDLKSVGALRRYCELYEHETELSDKFDCLLDSYADGHAFTETDVSDMAMALQNFIFNEEE